MDKKYGIDAFIKNGNLDGWLEVNCNRCSQRNGVSENFYLKGVYVEYLGCYPCQAQSNIDFSVLMNFEIPNSVREFVGTGEKCQHLEVK